MRFEAFVCALLAAAVSAGCSAPAQYASTAEALSRTERPTAFYSLAKAWKPLGRNYSYAIPGDENVRAQLFLRSCIDELAGRFDPAPVSAVRAVQIGECMHARGWHLVLQESIAPP